MNPISSQRRQWIGLAAGAFAALALALPTPGHAQAYPNRPIKIIIPSAAGGPGDLVVRTISARMSEILGQPIVAENRSGAAGTIGVNAVARSAPDGYTLLLTSTTHSATEALYPQRGYVLLRDLVPVAGLSLTPNLLVVNPGVPANNVRELVALAKQQPGGLSYASAGVGNIFHLVAEMFMKAADIKMMHVPYSQSSAARTDLAAGQVKVMFDAMSTMAPIASTGRVRALATTGARRSPVMPDVPTIAESGYPGFEADTWTGLLVPAGTPDAVVARLHDAITRTLRDKEVAATFAHQGSEAILESQPEFAQRVRRSVDQWGELIRSAGIKVE